MDRLERREGYKDKVYVDKAGRKPVKTIGAGINVEEEHNKKLLPADVVSGKRAGTREELDNAKNENLKIAENDAKNFVGEGYDTLEDGAKEVLVDMHYNMGSNRMNGFDKLQQAAKTHDYGTMADEIENSLYAKQTKGRAQEHIKTLRAIGGSKKKDIGQEMQRQIKSLFGIEDAPEQGRPNTSKESERD